MQFIFLNHSLNINFVTDNAMNLFSRQKGQVILELFYIISVNKIAVPKLKTKIHWSLERNSLVIVHYPIDLSQNFCKKSL